MRGGTVCLPKGQAKPVFNFYMKNEMATSLKAVLLHV